MVREAERNDEFALASAPQKLREKEASNKIVKPDGLDIFFLFK